MWKTLSVSEVSVNVNRFYDSVFVWLSRPNVCCKTISSCILEQLDSFDSDDKISNLNQPSKVSKQTKIFAVNLARSCQTLKCSACSNAHNFTASSGESFVLHLRKLIPRQPDLYQVSYEIVVTRKDFFLFISLDSHTFLPIQQCMAYTICFCNCNEKLRKNYVDNENIKGVFSLSTMQCSDELMIKNGIDVAANAVTETIASSFLQTQRHCFPSQAWLIEKLFPTLCKWSVDDSKKQLDFVLPPSLSLIDQEKYAFLYHKLKREYGLSLSKVWPEVTDPQKYVYEDVAIATYLIILWERERVLLNTEKKQSFADLGCGNGLLVYILTSEGYPGIGFDIRRRKIWDIYGQGVALKEATITPNDLHLIKDYDWLLGNHSDELTPWIPVMALRSGYDKRFWVLPCCFFDFHRKYERSNPSIGQYHDYLKYVEGVGHKCGYEMETDVMRIPSTKRVCFVGMSKNYEKSKHDNVKKDLDDYIIRRSGVQSPTSSVASFQPRPAEIQVRNCTKIDRNIQNDVIKIISEHLLSTSNLIPAASGVGRMWNRGGKLVLSDAILLLPESVRNEMKKECGGIQTLLRNQNQVFQVSGGVVQLRNWTVPYESSKKKSAKRRKISIACKKTKPCWFESHHPDGCPLRADECSFIHTKSAKATDA